MESLKKLIELHLFWFDEIKIEHNYYQKKVGQWFMGRDPHFNLASTERFSSLLDLSIITQFPHENLSSKEYLALLILFDQIPRNTYKNDKRAYAFDSLAQELCLNALGGEIEKELSLPERMFLYMPLEHAEDRELQKLSVEKFTLNHQEAPESIKKWTRLALDKAYEHKATIDEFGHFPHRVR